MNKARAARKVVVGRLYRWPSLSFPHPGEYIARVSLRGPNDEVLERKVSLYVGDDFMDIA